MNFLSLANAILLIWKLSSIEQCCFKMGWHYKLPDLAYNRFVHPTSSLMNKQTCFCSDVWNIFTHILRICPHLSARLGIPLKMVERPTLIFLEILKECQSARVRVFLLCLAKTGTPVKLWILGFLHGRPQSLISMQHKTYRKAILFFNLLSWLKAQDDRSPVLSYYLIPETWF